MDMFDLGIAIHGKTNILPHDQCLKFKGKMLPRQDEFKFETASDEVKFEDIGIVANSTIHLSFFMLGGIDAGTGYAPPLPRLTH